jgi:hypothetical protein
MNKKDIALTVLGVLATMVVAYLIYKMQQRDAAAAAAASQDDSAAQAQAEQQAQEADASASYQYASLLSQVGSGVNLTGTTNSTTAAVSSSGDTATTGATGTSIDSSDINDLMSQIINDFAGSITSSTATPQTVASMIIPTWTGVTSNDLSGIPVTAQQAAAAAQSMTAYSTAGSFPASLESSSTLSSHPVQAHPIVSTGT